MKSLAFYFLFVYCGSFAQADSSKTNDKKTPFDPKGNYQTFAVRLRLLPWTIGDSKGYNALIGLQFSFFLNHSLSADVLTNYKNNNADAYYRNDSLIRPVRNRNESTIEFHFAYNYHFNFESLRKNSGLSFYTGINYRIGSRQLVSDTALYIGDNTISSNRQYYSIGPQVGLLWNLGRSRIFTLNLNITPFYNIANVTTTTLEVANSYTYHDTFKTYDFRVGLNLILWLKYRKR